MPAADESGDDPQAGDGASGFLPRNSLLLVSFFLTTAEFWFQSLQNWQSEFLAVAAIVCLSIFLRQQGVTRVEARGGGAWRDRERMTDARLTGVALRTVQVTEW